MAHPSTWPAEAGRLRPLHLAPKVRATGLRAPGWPQAGQDNESPGTGPGFGSVLRRGRREPEQAQPHFWLPDLDTTVDLRAAPGTEQGTRE